MACRQHVAGIRFRHYRIDAAIGEHEEVPTVEVAVEDAVDHGAFQEGQHQDPEHLVGVDAGRVHGLNRLSQHDEEPLPIREAACRSPERRARDVFEREVL